VARAAGDEIRCLAAAEARGHGRVSYAGSPCCRLLLADEDGAGWLGITESVNSPAVVFLREPRAGIVEDRALLGPWDWLRRSGRAKGGQARKTNDANP